MRVKAALRIATPACSAVIALIATGILGVLPMESSAASLIALGDLSGGDPNSRAFGISPDGMTVVGRGNSNSGNQAVRWTQAGGMEVSPPEVLPPPTTGLFLLFQEAYDVSVGGTTAVGVSRSFTGEAVRWTASGNTTEVIVPGGGLGSVANALSADGSVVVGFKQGEAFRWTQSGGAVGLGDLVPGGTSQSSNAFGVSADGSVVVGSANSPQGGQAFRWTEAGGMQGLGDLPGGNFSSRAFDVSADGSAVVGESRAGALDQAFLWTQAGGMIGLGGESAAHGVSANGSVVVGERTSTEGEGEAFYWTQAGGMDSLLTVLIAQNADGVSEWSSLAIAFDVSPDGTAIVGWGTHNDPSHDLEPHPEAFLARLDAAGADGDGDGIPDSADNCPFHASANAADTDADGRGDPCECTDQNGDGRNTVADIVGINVAIFNPAQVTPLCDGTGEGDCNVNDIIAANVEIFSPGNTSTCPSQPVAGP